MTPMYLELSTVFISIITFISMFSLVVLKFYECFNLVKENKNLTNTSNQQLVIIDVQARMIEKQKDELEEQRQLYQKLLQTKFNF